MIYPAINKVLASAVSATASFTASPSSIDVTSYQGYCVQAIWSGATSASADTVTIAGSTDGTNFDTTVGSIAVNSTSGNKLVNIVDHQYPYVQVKFNRVNAAAGIITINLTAKGQG